MDFGHTGDSFHTLFLGEQIGLAMLSVGLGGAMLAVTRRARGLLLWVALFWAFVWLSPQVYYLYYLAIFDDLPRQIVVRTPPGPVHLLDLLTFRAGDTMSAHATGLLGWGMIGTVLWGRWRAYVPGSVA